MSSRKLTMSIAAAAAAIAVGGGSYGIVSATSSSAPRQQQSAPACQQQPLRQRPVRYRRRGIQRPVRTGRRRSSGHGQQRVHVGLHADDISGPEGDRSTRRPPRRTRRGRARPRQVRSPTANPSSSWDDQRNDHHGHAGHRATGSSGSAASSAAEVVPFQRGAPSHVQAGRPDPGELQPGIGDDRQRNGSQQGDRSGAGRLPGRHRRPCGAS